MLSSPLIVTDVASVILTPVNSRKGKLIILRNTGTQVIAVKFDGSATTLTFGNGLLIPVGAERSIEPDGKGMFQNEIYAICDSGTASTISAHVIE